MKVLIIEDEVRAANKMKQLIKKVRRDALILEVTESVAQTITFLKSHTVDIIFSDIQLTDGLSFEVFRAVSVSCPIIFTTAYDQYAIEAFRTNGIDYLMKPFDQERLEEAIAKVERLTTGLSVAQIEVLSKLANGIGSEKEYKRRFAVKIGGKIKTIDISEVIVFFSEEKATYLITRDHRKYLIDYSLDQLVPTLDPAHFFRISRKFVVVQDACKELISWSNTRMKIEIEGLENIQMIVAREKLKAFKEWLGI